MCTEGQPCEDSGEGQGERPGETSPAHTWSPTFSLQTVRAPSLGVCYMAIADCCSARQVALLGCMALELWDWPQRMLHPESAAGLEVQA